MKKILGVFLLLAMLLGLCACSATQSTAGFNSLEECVDALVSSRTGLLSKKEIKEMATDAMWEKIVETEGFSNFDSYYAEYEATINESVEKYKNAFGDDYKITYVYSTAEKKDFELSEEERQEIKKFFGVEPSKIEIHLIEVSVTIKGNLGETTNSFSLNVAKVGDRWYDGDMCALVV